jgi:hypothetical protein
MIDTNKEKNKCKNNGKVRELTKANTNKNILMDKERKNLCRAKLVLEADNPVT